PLGTLKTQHSDPQISPNGAFIVTLCDDGSSGLFDGATGESIATLRPSACAQVAFSPDDRKVVTAADDGTGFVWEPATGRESARLEGHAGNLLFVAFCARGARIVTAADDRTVRLWNADSGAEIRQMPSHRSHPPAVSPDGSRIAVISLAGEAQVCDALTGEVIGTTGKGQANPRFSPDGSRFATEAVDGSFRISDAESLAFISALPRDDGDRFHGFSPDGRFALTSARDGT